MLSFLKIASVPGARYLNSFWIFENLFSETFFRGVYLTMLSFTINEPFWGSEHASFWGLLRQKKGRYARASFGGGQILKEN